MKLIDGYVRIIEDVEREIVREEECKIINFFSWSNGTNTFPVALIMMKNGDIGQYPATSVRFKLKSAEINTPTLH